MSKVPNVTLNNGRTMPILGLGTWQSEDSQVTQAVKDAIDAGYRHIDCAYAYGNEAAVGEALSTKMTDGTVKREEIFITSKLWNTFHSRDLVLPGLKETLKNLGLSYLDLFLIHWPMGYKERSGDIIPRDKDGKVINSDVDYMETWLGMEEVLKSGLVMAIGLSNFNHEQIDRILGVATVQPAMLQVECNAYLTQKKLLEYCHSKGITMTAYSPLGSPKRPLATPDDPVLMEDPKLLAIASKHSKSAAQVLIRFQIQRGIVCIPKSITKSRIESNFQVFDFELSEEDMSAIFSMDCNIRAVILEWNGDHPHYPFHAEY